MTLDQQPPTECYKCKEKGVSGQRIDLEKVGQDMTTGKDQWMLYDHGTRTQHVHRKLCDECKNPIMFNTIDRKFHNAVEPFDLHNCRSDPERYKKPDQEKLETNSINTVVETKESNYRKGPEETNPIQQAVQKQADESSASKKNDLIWALVKNINEKTDKIKTIEQTLINLIEVVNKHIESTDKAVAVFAGAKFKTGSGNEVEMKSLEPNPIRPPTQEEIENAMNQEAEDEMPHPDDEQPPT
jgi:hypothetical protein